MASVKKISLNVKILRQDPSSEINPRYGDYCVEVNEGARVLDVLIAVRDNLDSSLSFRYCCGAGQCGSCAIKINGEPKLACMTIAEDGMILEPLDLPVVKDLVVDLVSELSKMPGLVPCGCGELPEKEEIDRIKPIRDCIECLCCVSVCPAMRVVDFAGPTLMRQEMRLALDPRSSGNRIPLTVEEGLFTCTSCQACYLACPKKIAIPGRAIEKLRELANRQGLTLDRHKAVAELVRTTGRSVEKAGETFLEMVPEVIEPYGEVRAEVGFYVGCMYNMRVVRTCLDTIEVLKRNGIRVIVPKEQVCCGSPLIRTGQTQIL
jgi:fumarate reductase (CoM/CoB) subunit B